MIKVYAMNVSGIDVGDTKLLSRMSEKRLEKINKCRVLALKKQSMGAELLLNKAVKLETGASSPVKWETDKNGKLFVPDCEFHVNLSHSGDYAVCAVCDSEIGVDIEQVKQANIPLAKRFFTAEECEFIEASANPNEAFYDVWVKKESFIKAVGKGLAIPLSKFCVLNDTIEYEGKTYRFKRYSVKDKDYRLSVCFAV